MPNKFYSLPKSVFENYHAKIKDWVKSILPTKTSDLDNDSDFLDQLALSGIVASNFSTSSTYEIGDYVLYNHTLYRCTTAISSAGAWDSSKWTATKTQDIFSGSTPGLVPAAESGDADKVLKGDGTWGVVSGGSGGSTARVSYDAQTEELSLDFSPPPADSVLIGDRYYHYVKIGNQLWIDENLDWKFDGCNIGNMTMSTTSKEAGYYNNDEATYGSNGKKYGLLYNWAAVNYIEQNKSTMLPEGWHIPSSSDYGTLVNFIGNNATSIKSTAEWNSNPGTDTYGLSLYPSGGYFNGVGFTGLSTDCYLWTSSVPLDAIYVNLASTTDNISYTGQTTKMNYMSLRLVKTLT